MQIKMLTYNIHKGFNWRNSQATIKKIKEAIVSSGVDVVFLQEIVGENKPLSNKHEEWIDAQHEYLADSIWTDMAYAKNAVYDHRHHGNAILSRFPIKDWAQFDISTNKREQRGILACDLETPQGIVHAFCVHLDLFHKGRTVQYNRSMNLSKKEAVTEIPKFWRAILTTGIRRPAPFLKDFNEASKVLHGDYQKTFPANYPLLKLDRIYIKGIHPTEVRALRNKKWKNLSDHCPLYMSGEVDW